MSQYFQIHPENPQRRLVKRAVEILQGGGLIVYPTDSSYAFGWLPGEKEAQERVKALRRLDDRHNYTLICRDMAEAGRFAKVGNEAFRLIKTHTPGPYTFILEGTRDLPKRLLNPRRKTVGIRIPDHPITQALLEAAGGPLMSSTLYLPGESMPLNDPEEVRERLQRQVDAVIDGGPCSLKPTTVVDLSSGSPTILRAGRGEVASFA